MFVAMNSGGGCNDGCAKVITMDFLDNKTNV
jgi:hypothetical protein